MFNTLPEFMRIHIAFSVHKKFREQYHKQHRVKQFEVWREVLEVFIRNDKLQIDVILILIRSDELILSNSKSLMTCDFFCVLSSIFILV